MKLARAASITAVLLEEGLGFLTHGEPTTPALEGPADPALPVPEAETAVRLRRTLERLGPTFVKFGQMLATRVDLFSPPFIDELSKLHASVAPFDAVRARAIVEEELGRPIDAVFSELSEDPVASASIAQVHRGRLRRDGSEVAVKIQRPGLDETLLADLDTLVVLSSFIDRLVPSYHRTMVHRVAQEYALRARTELDFLAEAAAIEGFGAVLDTLPEFRVPALHRDLCTPRVLVMAWMDGVKLGDLPGPADLVARGVDPEAFCRSMLKLQLSMSYEHGLVHGDTHPGNVFLMPDGGIALIDFGLHGSVPRALRDKMLEMLFAQASGRTDDAVEAFVQIFQPDPKKDLTAFRVALREVLVEGGEAGSIGANRVTAQLVRGMRVGAAYELRAQSDLFMVIRNLTIVEGIVIRYCPTLDPAAEVKEITGDILRRRFFGPAMQDDLTQLVPQLLLTLSQRPKLASRLLKLERAFNEARDLGDFLRKEGVLEASAPPPRAPLPWILAVLLALMTGLSVGLLL